MGPFIRFQSAVPNRRGRHPGLFAMANGLARSDALSVADATWLADANRSMEAAYADPTKLVPSCYDPALHPGARSWFKVDAVRLLRLTEDYLALLDRYDVRWTELRTRHPGRVTYEDDVQVVAVPFVHPAHWPFEGAR
nr:hypothetical protein [Tersicoccus sp. Bi-70]